MTELDVESICFSADPAAITVEMVAKLFGSVGFGAEASMIGRRDMIARMFGPGSHGFFGLTPDGDLAGLIRVLSDDYSVTWLAELTVHPDWQKRGLGAALIRAVIGRFGHTAIYSWGLPGQDGFFKKSGIFPKAHLLSCSRAPNDILHRSNTPSLAPSRFLPSLLRLGPLQSAGKP